VLQGGSLLALAVAAGLDLSACSGDDDSGSSGSGSASGEDGSPRPVRSPFDAHQRAVLDAAAARLVPGPQDEPGEADPGAREARATDYIVTLLGALSVDPPRVFAGGPFSDRAGARHDDMARFLPLDDATRRQWRKRVADLVARYRAGLQELDRLAGGDFAKASAAEQDAALVKNPHEFTDLLFQHTIEGCYSVPEYGGNHGRVMWKAIRFPGDVQPRGYAAEQVTKSDGPDPIEATGIVADALALLTSTAPGSPTPPSSLPARGAP
jgi:hypothetical protein